MKNIKQKISKSVVAGALLLSSFIQPAFADIRVDISGNGRGSDNDVTVRHESHTSISQSNNADIDNNIRIRSNTGGNEADDNTRGRVSIRSGDIDTSIDVSNFANLNFARIGDSHDSNDWENHDWLNDWNDDDDSWDNNNNHDNDNHDNHDTQDNNHDYSISTSSVTDGYNHDDHSKNGVNLQAYLDGDNEVPGPGDQDGSGTVKVNIDQDRDLEVCVWMHVDNIQDATATAAHIHYGWPGIAGPVVVTLPTPDSNGDAHGCVDANENEVEHIINHHNNYYINVHTNEYPDGAVRGQLYH